MANRLDPATIASSPSVSQAKGGNRAAPAMHNGNVIKRYAMLPLWTRVLRRPLLRRPFTRLICIDSNQSSWPS